MLDLILSAIRSARINDEDGATAVEYGLMVALIAVVIVAAVLTLGTGLRDSFSSTSDCIADSATCPAAPVGG